MNINAKPLDNCLLRAFLDRKFLFQYTGDCTKRMTIDGPP